MQSPTITLIDYGAGNLASVMKALARCGARTRVSAGIDDVETAEALVIPGVGHFAATAALDARWRRAIRGAIGRGAPTLGICLGLQWMFDGSDEAPELPGLGLFPGSCFALDSCHDRAPANVEFKVPHVGWNTLDLESERSVLMSGLQSGAYAYFTHSFAAPVGAGTITTTLHGCRFASVVERDTVFGVQFHPEKSGRTGLHVLSNFVSVVRGDVAC